VGVPVLTSDDLVRWKRAGTVFRETPAWARQAVPGPRDIWAPDIARIGDRWHLYYCVSVFGTNRSVIGMATNRTLDPSDPDHRWVDRGLILRSRPGKDDWNALDPHVATDEEGKPWLFWGSFWSGIKAARLDPESGRLAEPLRIVDIARRPHPGAIEAPYVVRKDGWFWLFVSFDFTARGAASDYKMMVGRSKKLLGPYVDYKGRRMLDGWATLLAAGHGRWRGPGHNSVIETDEGRLLVHHVNDAERDGADMLQVRPLLWLEDGWPVAADPASRGAWGAGTGPRPMGRWRHSADYRPESVIEIVSGGVLRSHHPGDRWRLEGGRRLFMNWPRPEAPGGTWEDLCRLSGDGNWYVGRNQIGSVIRGRRVTPR
jgi:arabinan endo-1,5-alpha-L-arabinosidase